MRTVLIPLNFNFNIVAEQKTIVVTGAHGQLASAFKAISGGYPDCRFIFLSKQDCDITDRKAVELFFSTYGADACINCAAYTAVDLAETEREMAMAVNATAPGNLASACLANGILFFHFSTDYVFDGKGLEPYIETDPTGPLNMYGKSKLAGEQAVLKANPYAIIIRTSWVYGSYGKNFVRTMCRLMNERESINVVNDQFGCPTFTEDLASAVMAMLSQEMKAKGGLYHYCNNGVISWFDFAMAIRELIGSSCSVNPIPAKEFPTAALRPAYSALNTQKIRDTFHLPIPDWKVSLKNCIRMMQ